MANPGQSSTSADAWLEAGRHYWDAWTSLYSQPGSGSSRSWPWTDGLEAWWRAMTPSSTPDTHDIYGKLIEQGKIFLNASEEFTRFLLGSAAGAREASSWHDDLAARFADLRAAFLRSSADPSEAARTMMAFWQTPPDHWRQLERLFSVPALGYTREFQEQWQDLGRLWLDYQRSLQAYTAAFSRLSADTFDRWSGKIRERIEAKAEITTLRPLYDLWVDAGEEAYHALVTTDEYAKLYGDLVNALMALKQRGRQLADDAAGALGMPTSRGMATVQRRQQDLARELQRLRREIETLRADRSDARDARPAAPDAAPATRKAPRTKRAGNKKRGSR